MSEFIFKEVVPQVLNKGQWRSDESSTTFSDEDIKNCLGKYGLTWKTIFDTGFISKGESFTDKLKFKLALLKL